MQDGADDHFLLAPATFSLPQDEKVGFHACGAQEVIEMVFENEKEQLYVLFLLDGVREKNIIKIVLVQKEEGFPGERPLELPHLDRDLNKRIH